MVPKRRVLAGVCALVLAVGVAACSSSSKSSAPTTSGTGSGSAQATGTPIKVGTICGCTGPFATDEGPAADVYKAWVKTVNATGGIDGHPIDLITEDDGGVPGTSVTAAQTLISDHVAAIVDNTDLDSAWSAAVQKAGIPVVGMELPDVPFYTSSDFYPDGQTNDSAVYAVVATAKAAGAKNLGVIYCAEAPTCQALVPLVKKAGAQMGLPVTYSASISATAPNYTAQCVAAQQAHITALAVFDVSEPDIKLGTDCNQQDYDPIYVTEGFGYSPSQGQAPGLSKDMWSEYDVLPLWDTSNAQIRAMDAATDKYYPSLRSNTTSWNEDVSSAWASGLLLEDAVKAGGLTAKGTVTSAEITTGLEALHGDNLDGMAPAGLSFTAGKDHLVDCWFTTHIKNGVTSLANNGKPTCESGASS